MFSSYQQVLLYGYQMWKTHEHATILVFPHLFDSFCMFTLGYPNSIVGRSLTRCVAGSVLVCPTSFWMPCCWTPRSPMRRSWRCGNSVTFLTFSKILVVLRNSFVSFDGKPFQAHPSSSGVSLETTEWRSPDGGRISGPALLGPGRGVSVAALVPKDESEEAATHGGALCF